MLTSSFLVVWGVLGIFTTVVDAVMAHRRYSGKLGERVRTRYLDTAARVGGRRRLFIISVFCDLAVWPLGLAGCLLAWHLDWRTCQAELAERSR
jgi:hypothetical protein